MQPSPIGLPVEELDTPALLLDLEVLEENVERVAEYHKCRHIQWRPHAKGFKSPAIAHMLKRAGAIGVTVAKVSEAEVMAAAGIDDILIAHLVVGDQKTSRLAALQRQSQVKVTVDHADQIEPMAEAARNAGVTIGALVDMDLGLERCGVRSVEEAVTLASLVAQTPGLRFEGIMGYEGHTHLIPDQSSKREEITRAIAYLANVRGAVEASGLTCRIVSAGGSGSYQFTANLPGVTETQAGGGIFACRYYTQVCRVEGLTPALSVLATVVSRPTPQRAVLDIGLKSISNHHVMPALRDYENCLVIKLAAEHAVIEVGAGEDFPIGKKLAVTPGYSDLTFMLHDRVIGHRWNKVETVWPLLGRGMLQ